MLIIRKYKKRRLREKALIQYCSFDSSFNSLSLAIAAETLRTSTPGRPNMNATSRWEATRRSKWLFLKGSDTYVEKSSGENQQKGQVKGNNTCPSEPKWWWQSRSYSKSVNEFMTLTMKNGILFGTFIGEGLQRWDRIRKNNRTEREVPERRKREAFQQASSEDDEKHRLSFVGY